MYVISFISAGSHNFIKNKAYITSTQYSLPIKSPIIELQSLSMEELQDNKIRVIHAYSSAICEFPTSEMTTINMTSNNMIQYLLSGLDHVC